MRCVAKGPTHTPATPPVGPRRPILTAHLDQSLIGRHGWRVTPDCGARALLATSWLPPTLQHLGQTCVLCAHSVAKKGTTSPEHTGPLANEPRTAVHIAAPNAQQPMKPQPDRCRIESARMPAAHTLLACSPLHQVPAASIHGAWLPRGSKRPSATRACKCSDPGHSPSQGALQPMPLPTMSNTPRPNDCRCKPCSQAAHTSRRR